MLFVLAFGCVAVPAIAGGLVADRATIYVSEYSRLRHLAELGDPNAQFLLGNLYFTGKARPHIVQSDEKAFEFYMKAAKQGHAGAQHNVAVLYLKGRGVKRNVDLAIAWFMLSAKNGNRSAQRVIARLQQEMDARQWRKLKSLHQQLAQEIKTPQVAK